MKCPICRSDKSEMFFEIDDVPIFCNILCSTKADALNVQKAQLNLSFCPNCMHVYNSVFNPTLLEYTSDYENSLHFSPKFQKYAKELAVNIVEKYKIKSKRVIDIGCGQGDFLSIVCEIGNNRGFGFDPSFRNKEGSKFNGSRVEIVKDYYSSKYSDYHAELLCCRHVLEHIFNPTEFLTAIRRTIRRNDSCILFFEVPNILYTLRDMGIWDIIYEHFSYFNEQSLTNIFQLCGFEVLHVYETYLGQFLCIEAKLSSKSDNIILEKSEDLKKRVKQFQNQYVIKKERFAKNLGEIKENNLRSVLWGAGSKGITFLNALNIREQIEYVIDINPHKQGKYVAGTGQKIMPPPFIKEYRPDLMYVMNPIYLDEIQHMIENWGLEIKIQTA